MQLMQAPGMVDHLAKLEGRGVRVEALLALLLTAVLDALAAAEEAPRQAALAALLHELVSAVPLEPHAQAITQRLMELLSAKESLLESEAAPALQQTLRCATRPVFAARHWPNCQTVPCIAAKLCPALQQALRCATRRVRAARHGQIRIQVKAAF